MSNGKIVVGDLINFRGLVYAPMNENGEGPRTNSLLGRHRAGNWWRGRVSGKVKVLSAKLLNRLRSANHQL